MELKGGASSSDGGSELSTTTLRNVLRRAVGRHPLLKWPKALAARAPPTHAAAIRGRGGRRTQGRNDRRATKERWPERMRRTPPTQRREPERGTSGDRQPKVARKASDVKSRRDGCIKSKATADSVPQRFFTSDRAGGCYLTGVVDLTKLCSCIRWLSD